MFDCRGKEICLICGATDMRKGIDGLSPIINLRPACDPFDSSLFIFSQRRYDLLTCVHNSQAPFGAHCRPTFCPHSHFFK
jgi:transposase